MTIETLRILVAVVLIAHGIGHVMGIMTAMGMKLSDSNSSDSWLLTRFVGDTIPRILSVIVWGLAMVGFVAAGLGLLNLLVPFESWQELAIGSSIISLIGLVVFPFGLATTFNKVAAGVVDVAVLVGLLWLGWPPGIA
jgi:hypothetical protein